MTDYFYTEETWLTIDEFPQYEISNRANVRYKSTKGYVETTYTGNSLKVKLRGEDKKLHTVGVKELMAKAFCGGPHKGCEVCFRDGNSHNLVADNLVWRKGINKTDRYYLSPIRVKETGEIYNSLYDYCEVTGNTLSDAKRAIENSGRYVTKSRHHLEWAD